MTKSKIFFIFSLSFLAGVGMASFYYSKIISLEFIYLLFAASLIFFSLSYKNKTAALGFGAVFFAALGMFLFELKIDRFSRADLDKKEFQGEAVITNEPEDKGKYQKIVISPTEKNDLKILLRVYDRQNYSYGEKLSVGCLLKKPENLSEGDQKFDYSMYLAKEGIFYECQKTKIKRTYENEGNVFFRQIFKLKRAVKEKIENQIPSPEAGLMSGFLLGGSDAMSEEWREKFSITGMTHIVAVSGYNVTIIAEYLMILGIFLGLWRPQAFWFAVLGIALFVIMIGLPSSAVRAAVMGTLLLWAMKNGRLANSKNAIIFSAVIMLIFNPLLLRYDAGFQLSFLATLGIVYLYPIFEGLLLKKFLRRENMIDNTKKPFFGRPISMISEMLFLTLSAQIFVLPVILFNFEKLSLISPLANLLILPVIPITMMLGFLAVVVGFIFAPLSQVLSWLAFLPLKYETWMVEFLSGFKYSFLSVGISRWGAVVWYIILLGVIFFCRKKIMAAE